MLSFDLFVENTGFLFLQDDLFRFQTNILTLLVFFLFHIPDIIMAAALNICLGLTNGTAKTVIDL